MRLEIYCFHGSWAEESSVLSSPGKPNILRLRSIEPTAMYLESGPNLTHVALPANSLLVHKVSAYYRLKNMEHRLESYLPVPDRSGRVLIGFHSAFTLAVWNTLTH